MADLRRIAGEVAEPAAKVVALYQLTEVAAYSGFSAAAIADATAAEQIVDKACPADAVLRAYAWTARALALRCHGDETTAAQFACRSRRSLYGRTPVGAAGACLTEAVIANGLVLSEYAVERGDFTYALAVVNEMASFANRTGARPLARMRAALHELCVRGHPPPDTQTIARLQHLLARALEGGLMLHAGAIAATLTEAYRFTGQPRMALECFISALDLFRRMPMGEPYGELLLQLAAAYTEAGQAGRALPLLEEARHVGSAGRYVYAASFIYEAYARLEMQDPAKALKASWFAIDCCRRLDRPRYIGTALWLAAVAFEREGKRVSARRCIAESIGILKACGGQKIG